MKIGNLSIEVDDDRRHPTIVLAGEMDAASDDAGPYLVERMRVAPDAEWRIDMSGLGFVDSSGLRAVLQANRSLRPDGSLVIVDPSPAAASLLRMSCIDRFVPVVAGGSSATPAD